MAQMYLTYKRIAYVIERPDLSDEQAATVQLDVQYQLDAGRYVIEEGEVKRAREPKIKRDQALRRKYAIPVYITPSGLRRGPHGFTQRSISSE